MIYVRSSTEVKYTIFLSKDIEKFGFSVALAVAYVLPNLDWIANRDLSIFSVQAARGTYRSGKGEYLAIKVLLIFNT